MPGRMREPALRDLDIYRLVVVRRWKQKHVAESFGVQPARVSQVVRRVRAWVDERVGAWLFPGRNDLRFLAALDRAQIRIHEADENPQNVTIEHASGSLRYIRTATIRVSGVATSPAPSELSIEPGANASAKGGAKLGANLSPQPRNFLEQGESGLAALTSFPPVTSAVGVHQ